MSILLALGLFAVVGMFLLERRRMWKLAILVNLPVAALMVWSLFHAAGDSLNSEGTYYATLLVRFFVILTITMWAGYVAGVYFRSRSASQL